MQRKMFGVLAAVGMVWSIGGCGSDDETENPKVWGAPARIDAAGSPGARGDLAAAGIDASGNAMAIWRQGGDAANDGQIQFSRSAAGGAWSAPAGAGSCGKRAGTGPIDLAMDGAGNAIAVWESNHPAQRNPTVSVRGARFSPSNGWSADSFINGLTAFTGTPNTPPAVQDVQVALGQGGHAVVAYSSNFDPHITVAIEPPGTILNDLPTRLDSASNFAFFPKLAFDGSGTAMIVWGQFNPGEILSCRYAPARGLSAPVTVTGPMESVEGLGLRGVAVNASGAAVALWIQTVGDFSALEYWANTASAGGAWSAPVRLGPQGGYNSADRTNSDSVAIDASGNAIALMPQAADTPQAKMMFSRLTAGGGWSAPAEIGPSAGGSISQPSIAFDADGNAIALWLQTSAAGGRVIQARFDGAAWTAPAALSTNASSGAPRLAVASAGRAVATWAGDQAIWAARFE